MTNTKSGTGVAGDPAHAPAIALEAALEVAAERAGAEGIPESIRRHVAEGLGRARLLVSPDPEDTLISAGESLLCDGCGETERFKRRIVYAHKDLVDGAGFVEEYDAEIEEYDNGVAHGFFCRRCGSEVVPLDEEERRELLIARGPEAKPTEEN